MVLTLSCRDDVLTTSEFESWAPTSPVMTALLSAFTMPERFLFEFSKWLTRLY